MQRLDLIVGAKGMQVCMQTTPGADVITYVIAVSSWGGQTLATWHPAELEGAGGACFVLGNDAGYDLTLIASIRKGGAATIDAQLNMNPPGAIKQYHVDLPDAEAPVVDRVWSIAMQ